MPGKRSFVDLAGESKLHLADRTQAAIFALQQRVVPLKDALEKDEYSR